MGTKCCSTIKPPIDPNLFQRSKRKYRAQRKRTLAEGTPNSRNELDYKDDANWITTGEVWMAIDPRGGRQAEIAEIQLEVTTARAYLRWSTVTGAIDSGYRMTLGTGTTRKVWQVYAARDWWGLNEWMVLSIAEVN